MYPDFNMLYKNPPKTSPSKELDMSMKSLLIDEVVEGITVNIVLQRKVYDILKYPEQDIENILWRKNILNDMRKNPSLLHELEYVNDLDKELREALKIVKVNASSIMTTTGGRSMSSGRESSIFTVQTLADCIVKVLNIYTQYDKTLQRINVESEFFIQMKEFVHKQITNPVFEELRLIAADLVESLNLNTSFVILAKLDKYIRIQDCEIFRLTPDPYNYSPESEGMKDKDKNIEYIGFEPESDQQLQFFAERGMIRLTNLMESIVLQLKKPFDNIENCFFFYRFADLLEKTYEKLGLPYCVAEYSTEGNRFECENIYDLWFSIKQAKKNKDEKPGDILVPNNAILPDDCPAYVITGKNNAGKTVFLRAVGIIQVLGQAGLPVPCTSAIITPVANIFAYFTALDIGQGRFEEEVETVSNFLDIMQPKDMFLFNEVYQSTSFDEASIALSEFISVTAVYGARVIAVTHLPDMKKNLGEIKESYGYPGTIRYYKAEEKDGAATHKFIPDND